LLENLTRSRIDYSNNPVSSISRQFSRRS